MTDQVWVCAECHRSTSGSCWRHGTTMTIPVNAIRPYQFLVIDQCADCGYTSEDAEDFRRHHRRKVHRDAVRPQ